MTKDGLKKPNYFGSLTQAATVRVGNYKGEEVFTPFKSLLPMVNPEDLVLGGWDISGLNLADAMERAQVGYLLALCCCNGSCPEGLLSGFVLLQSSVPRWALWLCAAAHRWSAQLLLVPSDALTWSACHVHPLQGTAQP